MKYSTGRGTRCKHSTSMDWEEVKKKQRRCMLRYSTGRTSPLKHSSDALVEKMKRRREIHAD